MNPRERGDDVMSEQSCDEPIEHDAPAVNKPRETGDPSDGIRVGGATDRSASAQKQSIKKGGANVPTPCGQCDSTGLPTLCGYCSGLGVVLEGFMGYPMTCVDCKGDGIARG